MPDPQNVENSLALFAMSNARSTNKKVPPSQELKNLFKIGKKPRPLATKESNFINKSGSFAKDSLRNYVSYKEDPSDGQSKCPEFAMNLSTVNLEAPNLGSSGIPGSFSGMHDYSHPGDMHKMGQVMQQARTRRPCSRTMADFPVDMPLF
jgi:hypothetical protein